MKLPVSENWENVKLTLRAGRAKGKYKMCWNTKNVDSGEEMYIDFEEVDWKANGGSDDSIPNPDDLSPDPDVHSLHDSAW